MLIGWNGLSSVAGSRRGCPYTSRLLANTTHGRCWLSAMHRRTLRIPGTFVDMHSCGSCSAQMTRETAARWMTPSHPISARRTRSRSRTSPWLGPDVRMSKPLTSNPRPMRATRSARPTRPDEPVTSTWPVMRMLPAESWCFSTWPNSTTLDGLIIGMFFGRRFECVK